MITYLYKSPLYIAVALVAVGGFASVAPAAFADNEKSISELLNELEGKADTAADEVASEAIAKEREKTSEAIADAGKTGGDVNAAIRKQDEALLKLIQQILKKFGSDAEKPRLTKKFEEALKKLLGKLEEEIKKLGAAPSAEPETYTQLNDVVEGLQGDLQSAEDIRFDKEMSKLGILVASLRDKSNGKAVATAAPAPKVTVTFGAADRSGKSVMQLKFSGAKIFIPVKIQLSTKDKKTGKEGVVASAQVPTSACKKTVVKGAPKGSESVTCTVNIKVTDAVKKAWNSTGKLKISNASRKTVVTEGLWVGDKLFSPEGAGTAGELAAVVAAIDAEIAKLKEKGVEDKSVTDSVRLCNNPAYFAAWKHKIGDPLVENSKKEPDIEDVIDVISRYGSNEALGGGFDAKNDANRYLFLIKSGLNNFRSCFEDSLQRVLQIIANNFGDAKKVSEQNLNIGSALGKIAGDPNASDSQKKAAGDAQGAWAKITEALRNAKAIDEKGAKIRAIDTTISALKAQERVLREKTTKSTQQPPATPTTQPTPAMPSAQPTQTTPTPTPSAQPTTQQQTPSTQPTTQSSGQPSAQPTSQVTCFTTEYDVLSWCESGTLIHYCDNRASQDCSQLPGKTRCGVVGPYPQPGSKPGYRGQCA